MKPVIIIVGTRPECIKMMPVYYELKRLHIPVLLCSTAQHGTMLHDLFALFGVQPDCTLDVMRPNQDLSYLTQAVLEKTKELYRSHEPALVVVQGDTTTAMAAALSAFYAQIPVMHIEAGLRTYDLQAPFPEEMNRRVITTFAAFHCAPTLRAVENLCAEQVNPATIFYTGNTVVDALRLICQRIADGTVSVTQSLKDTVVWCKKLNKKLIVLTMHRRESFGGGIAQAVGAIADLLREHTDVHCFFPVHPNPRVQQELVGLGIADLPNVSMSAPLVYHDLIYVLQQADMVLTDSGGIQEEAVSLGKYVMVLREKTERHEAVQAGCAELVGTDPEKIKAAFNRAVHKKLESNQPQLYGDGHAAQKIVEIIAHHFFPGRCTKDKMKKVSVIGLGYIGLPTAIVAAQAGLQVSGYDVDARRVQAINAGAPLIQEPDLVEKLHAVLRSNSFYAATVLEPADYLVIAVPTPFTADKKPDLSYVFSAIDAISGVLKAGNTVIIESTVPVGATQAAAERLKQKTGMRAGKDFFVAHCPERVLPGKIFYELVHNARVIGGITPESAQSARSFYQHFVQGECHVTDAATAEMVKLVENSSRDVALAFAHQVAAMADAAGIDPYAVIDLANKHPRVNILRPSAGVGGHCIAVDPWFLVDTFPHDSALLKCAREVNDARPHQVVGMIHRAVREWQKTHEGVCTVTLLGLTYKPNSDDLRESPAVVVAHELCNQNNLRVLVVEPHVAVQDLPDALCDKLVPLSLGLQQANVVVYLVAHHEFAIIHPDAVAEKISLDVCGIRRKKGEIHEKVTTHHERAMHGASSAQCNQHEI